jgi:uncharacterized membrane protein SpoIIM required for sporulation
VAHGCVEISVMCLSGAAGAAVGEALIRPAHGDRLKSFQSAALRSGKLLVVCALLLAGSGIIEGYLSPRADVPLWMRVTIGAGYWLVMVILLFRPAWNDAAPRTLSTATSPTTPPAPR